jgi:RNA polymerase sigma factor (sigma-70 family)
VDGDPTSSSWWAESLSAAHQGLVGLDRESGLVPTEVTPMRRFVTVGGCRRSTAGMERHLAGESGGRGSTFDARSPVEEMGPHLAPTDATTDVLCDLLKGGRGRALRAQLAARHPERPVDEIEEAVQAAVTAFLAEAEAINDPGAAYAWLRTTAHRILGHEADRRRREVAVDPTAGGLERPTAVEAEPAGELMAGEDESDLAEVIRELAASFPPRRREVFALWAAGRKRPQIAAELGMRERVVKRELLEIMEEGRIALVRRSGGGCEQGESLVTRFVCGLAGTGEAAQARLHLERCGRCTSFAERMGEWREKAGALLPLPTMEAASPGLVGRTVGRVGEGIASVKRQVLGGGAQVKQQAAVAGYTRGADPTALTGIRPGAVAAVVAGCLAVGGGAATYCAQNGVDPLGAAAGLIAGTQEEPTQAPEPEPATPKEPAEEPVSEPDETQTEAPVYEPVVEEPAAEPSPTAGEPTEAHQAVSEPEPEPTPEEVAPPPEQSFEPASPDYPATETTTSSASTTPTTETESPAPVTKNQAPQFGGP